MPFLLSIVTPEVRVTEEDADSLVLPGGDGSYGILSRHAPMIGQIKTGILSMSLGTNTIYYVVGDGIAEIGDNRAMILTDSAVKASDLADAEAKLEALQKARSVGPMVSPESLSD